MTREPVRWSDAASDADPVLRAVVRYAQSIEPSGAEVAACAAVVARAESGGARSSGMRGGRGWSRRALLLVAALLGVAMAGAALAMTYLPSWRRPPLSVAVSSRRLPLATPTPARPATVEEPPAPSAAPAPARSASRVLTTTPPDASAVPSTELGLLNAARKELRQHPARTLALLSAHAEQFPGSAFAEERAALRVEALFGLGRTAEAERAYASFNATFPGSIYQLRLNGMRSAPR